MITNEQRLIEHCKEREIDLKCLLSEAPEGATYIHKYSYPFAREPKRNSKFMMIFQKSTGKWKSGNKYVSELSLNYASIDKLKLMIGA